ncbi:MAG: M24 family metallopeptidase [Vicinamibacterales bacterium]|jgi:methionine aminopeptidase|nr:M24 family metallopeptidase [Vicinamibacterales bacterium]HJN45359.1 M24 family metallopeptidase [Vicinamibacterales bacterium]
MSTQQSYGFKASMIPSRILRLLFTSALVLASATWASAQITPDLIRERTEREWTIKAEKMRRHLLPLMRQHEIDLWVILSRENAPDPLVELFGGYGVTGWYGHRNAYLFFDSGSGDTLETTALGTHLSGHLSQFYDTITLYGEEGLKPHLREYVEARVPRRIAINQSRTISMADGLTAELKAYLLDAVGAPYGDRLVSSEPLVVDYASAHTPAEDAVEREASAATFAILRRALSNEVITPGRTTLMDVQYWITAEWKRQGFEFNFPASLDLQRVGNVTLDDSADPVIERGDLLHVDFGVRTSGIVADQQKMAYVLRAGETVPPAGFVRAFEHSTHAAAIILEEMQVGRTGAAIKQSAETRAASEGIETLVYSHVQGYWVHDAGMWAIHDWPERYGDHPRFTLKNGDWVSLEFAVTVAVPEWDDQPVTIMREEDTLVTSDAAPEYLSGPQTDLWIIR